MKYMKYELVVVWETGEKEVYAYATEEEARTASNDFKKIFGNQVAWAGIRRVTTWTETK